VDADEPSNDHPTFAAGGNYGSSDVEENYYQKREEGKMICCDNDDCRNVTT